MAARQGDPGRGHVELKRNAAHNVPELLQRSELAPAASVYNRHGRQSTAQGLSGRAGEEREQVPAGRDHTRLCQSWPRREAVPIQFERR